MPCPFLRLVILAQVRARGSFRFLPCSAALFALALRLLLFIRAKGFMAGRWSCNVRQWCAHQRLGALRSMNATTSFVDAAHVNADAVSMAVSTVLVFDISVRQ